jgi:hypothetical protein
VRENGIGPASKHRRHELPPLSQNTRSQGVDPVMDAKEATSRDPLHGRIFCQPDLLELLQRDQPVLRDREPPDLGIDTVLMGRKPVR